jgi:transposase
VDTSKPKEDVLMVGKTKRSFSKAFKADAVRMYREGSTSISEVAAHLGISKAALYRWLRQAEQVGEQKAGQVDAGEYERLRREIEQLRMERDFLKKAAAFFAKNQS